MAVVCRVDEPAAETHVQAADNHDAARNSGKENELEKQVKFWFKESRHINRFKLTVWY